MNLNKLNDADVMYGGDYLYIVFEDTDKAIQVGRISEMKSRYDPELANQLP